MDQCVDRWLGTDNGSLVLVTGKIILHKAYAIREKDVIYRSGWIIQSTHTCPFNRIQHSAVTIGPFEKRFGLASLVLYTAGSNEADLRIRGLQEATAWTLKNGSPKKIADEPGTADNSWSIPQRQAKAGLVIILAKATVTIVKTLWPILIGIAGQKEQERHRYFSSSPSWPCPLLFWCAL